MMRWPWTYVEFFKVESCADGTLIVKPAYSKGVPGVLTRMALARWAEARLAKRKLTTAVTVSVTEGER